MTDADIRGDYDVGAQAFSLAQFLLMVGLPVGFLGWFFEDRSGTGSTGRLLLALVLLAYFLLQGVAGHLWNRLRRGPGSRLVWAMVPVLGPYVILSFPSGEACPDCAVAVAPCPRCAEAESTLPGIGRRAVPLRWALLSLFSGLAELGILGALKAVFGSLS